MDTDDLSNKTYKAILIEAEKFNHNLTLRFGLLSYQCKDEADYISKSKLLIEKMLKCNKHVVHGLFYGEPPLMKDFHDALNRIKKNIEKLNIK